MPRQKLSEEEKRARNRERQRRWRQSNPDRVREYNRRHYRPKDPEKAREQNHKWYEKNRLKSAYGITQDQWDAMLADQGGCCASCKREEPNGRYGKWHVDHCHTSGAVRGLLCHSCNVAIGLLQDNPTILRSAADYIEKHANDTR